MIQLPQRSVTRFFIPLIDVLTLMFCIFLLMPLVQGTTEPGAATPSPQDLPPTPPERQESSLLAQEREDLEKLRKEKIETLQRRLLIYVLEIDADTGKLFHYDPERTEIGNEGQAHALIQQQKQHAGGREVYFLFLYPRKLTGYPQERQMQQYDRWFQGAAHGFDNPRSQ